MPTEEKQSSIFDTPLEDISSLFENEKEEKNEIIEERSVFDPKKTTKEEEEDPEDDDDDQDTPEGDDDDDDEEEEEKKVEGKKKPAGRPKKPTVFGEGIKALIDADTDFMIYEEDEGRVDFTKDEFVELFTENIRVKSEMIAQATLDSVLESLSPTAQKLVSGELKGIKIADVVKDLEYYIDIENISENPTETEKEKVVKAYYSKLAKERKKDSSWITKQVEKIIDRGELDSEFEDAKEVIQKELDDSIEAKAKLKEQEALQKKKFKEYNAYYTQEVLKEENIFGIKLTKAEKAQIANILASFQIRPSDKKEKLGITAMIDSLIHSDKPKEAYKRLALMALAGTTPDQFIERLKTSAETAVTKEIEKKLKVASKSSIQNAPVAEKKSNKQPGSIF